MNWIRIRGARTHNLKNIDCDVPRNQLVVITGLSGSGKSSLAFDTLYAEGQRRYVESLSTYARQFLQLMAKPDVDTIEGLSPAISIEQKATSHNPRSTVGTVTEIHDYLRVLFARVGTPYCPDHQLPLSAHSVSQMVDTVLSLPEETALFILAPVVVDRKGELIDWFSDMLAQGFIRFRVHSGQKAAQVMVCEHPADFPKFKKNERHSIEVVIDRVKVKAQARQRLAESFETALRLAQGRAQVLLLDSDTVLTFNEHFTCPQCSYSVPELEPRLFSFNSPIGACPGCDGLGKRLFFDPKRIVAFPHLSLAAGAIKSWDRRNSFYFHWLQSLAAFYQFDLEQPFEQLPEAIKKIVLWGSGDTVIPWMDPQGMHAQRYGKAYPFEGIIPNFERRFRETDSPTVREELARYQNNQQCPECLGARLKREARFVRVGADHLSAASLFELNHWPLDQTLAYFKHFTLSGAKQQIAEKIVTEISARLNFLKNVGLSYLTLARSADSLSGGEAQRIRLASQIGSGLAGVMYILDEPSIGLHQRDNDRLIETLKHLRDLGNSVIIVEHDEEIIRASDYLIDMGPGAGVHGGQIIAYGTPAQIMQCASSITGHYLSGLKKIPLPNKRYVPKAEFLSIHGASGHNLKKVDLKIPVGLFTCVTGVSGSGKSTLVNDTLYRAVARELYRAQAEPAPFERIDGLALFDKVINVDQAPIGRTPRSNPATYTGVFTAIRELFAQVPQAKERGYGPGRFSFNVKGGRCEACQGDGMVKVEMHFLADIYVPCDLCGAKRYNIETLAIRYKEKNIHQVLEMTVEQAFAFFQSIPTISRKLQTLRDVGLGYLALGQSATTLSGGEAQRVKLSLELSKKDTGRTLYILDEPTTGLHFQDIELLLKVVQRLRDAGNTIVIIEHHLDVIKTADWIIDIGPEGGAKGGQIVACGTPETIAHHPNSLTGRYLKPLLKESEKVV